MKLKEPLRLQSNNCHRIFEADMDFECVSTNERNMGLEIDYEGIYDMPCPYCGKDIYAQVEAYEYPPGAINYVRNTVVDGAELQTELSERSFMLEEF